MKTCLVVCESRRRKWPSHFSEAVAGLETRSSQAKWVDGWSDLEPFPVLSDASLIGGRMPANIQIFIYRTTEAA